MGPSASAGPGGRVKFGPVSSLTGGVPSVSLNSAATAAGTVSVPVPAQAAVFEQGADAAAGTDGAQGSPVPGQDDDPPLEAAAPQPTAAPVSPRWIGSAPLWMRYAAGSLIATVLSQIALTVAYGLLGATAVVASIAAFFAGTVPNYFLNKAWAWNGHKLSQRRLIVSYLLVIGVTNVAAIVMTVAADSVIRAHVRSDGLRTGLLDLSYLTANLLMFVVKCVLFDGVLFKQRGSVKSATAGS